MNRSLLLILILTCWLWPAIQAQNVGIGTTTPDPKAALDIRSSDKGVLFPSLTSAQRNAIVNPPNGLHIYNKDEGCLNYYDSLLTSWNCYCEFDTCKVVVIKITANIDSLNFYESYGKYYPYAKKFAVIISPGVVIKGNYFVLPPPISIPVPQPAIRFSTIPGTGSITVKIINYGSIYGIGGIGGNGAAGNGVSNGCTNDVPATNGTNGFAAIDTRAGVRISIDNYGIIAGGAGGGGGGGRNTLGQYGGGGGGGASFGGPGRGGGVVSSCGPFGGCGVCVTAQNGTQGDLLTGGPGGLGASGGGTGGAGGALGQPGQNAPGAGGGLGGAVGKIVSGGSGNSIVNIAGGVSYGTTD